MVNQTIERLKNEKLLTQKTTAGIKVSNPKTLKLYIASNNPGRQVINSIKCHISEISRLVHHHLQPVV